MGVERQFLSAIREMLLPPLIAYSGVRWTAANVSRQFQPRAKAAAMPPQEKTPAPPSSCRLPPAIRPAPRRQEIAAADAHKTGAEPPKSAAALLRYGEEERARAAAQRVRQNRKQDKERRV